MVATKVVSIFSYVFIIKRKNPLLNNQTEITLAHVKLITIDITLNKNTISASAFILGIVLLLYLDLFTVFMS
nr:MAG TPA: hypothetical protein [Caudoviricetes sp.]